MALWLSSGVISSAYYVRCHRRRRGTSRRCGGGGNAPVHRLLPAPGTGAEGAAPAQRGRELPSSRSPPLEYGCSFYTWVGCVPQTLPLSRNVTCPGSSPMFDCFYSLSKKRNKHLSIKKFKNLIFASFMCKFSTLM